MQAEGLARQSKGPHGSILRMGERLRECTTSYTCHDNMLLLEYYYYSHIFPGFRAQHCNYATLLAGRLGLCFYR